MHPVGVRLWFEHGFVVVATTCWNEGLALLGCLTSKTIYIYIYMNMQFNDEPFLWTGAVTQLDSFLNSKKKNQMVSIYCEIVPFYFRNFECTWHNLLIKHNCKLNWSCTCAESCHTFFSLLFWSIRLLSIYLPLPFGFFCPMCVSVCFYVM